MHEKLSNISMNLWICKCFSISSLMKTQDISYCTVKSILSVRSHLCMLNIRLGLASKLVMSQITPDHTARLIVPPQNPTGVSWPSVVGSNPMSIFRKCNKVVTLATLWHPSQAFLCDMPTFNIDQRTWSMSWNIQGRGSFCLELHCDGTLPNYRSMLS